MILSQPNWNGSRRWALGFLKLKASRNTRPSQAGSPLAVPIGSSGSAVRLAGNGCRRASTPVLRVISGRYAWLPMASLPQPQESGAEHLHATWSQLQPGIPTGQQWRHRRAHYRRYTGGRARRRRAARLNFQTRWLDGGLRSMAAVDADGGPAPCFIRLDFKWRLTPADGPLERLQPIAARPPLLRATLATQRATGPGAQP